MSGKRSTNKKTGIIVGKSEIIDLLTRNTNDVYTRHDAGLSCSGFNVNHLTATMCRIFTY